MVKIALDPAMYHASMSVAEELRKAADLGYQHLELSPRPDWFFWHRYPKADAAAVVTDACVEAFRTGTKTAVSLPDKPAFYAGS